MYLEITWFADYDEDRHRTVVGRSGTSPTQTTINLGDDIALEWRIRGRAVRNVRATLSTVGWVNPGSPREYGDGSFQMYNRRALYVTNTTTYTLTVTGVVAGSSGRVQTIRRERRFTINVRRPGLVLDHHVDQDDLTVQLSLRNAGDSDMTPRPLNVHYQIQGIDGRFRARLAEDTFTAGRRTIVRGSQVLLGEPIQLPDRALAYGDISIRARAWADASLDTGWQTFSHTWETETLVASMTLLESLVGQGRIHNFSGASGDRLTRTPMVRGASYIEILGDRTAIDLNAIRLVFRGAVAGMTAYQLNYCGFYNDIVTRDTPDVYHAAGNRLGIRLSFDVSGDRNIKGYNYRHGVYICSEAPDIDVTRIDVDVLLRFGVRSGALTISGIQVEPHVDARFAGGWGILNLPVVLADLKSRAEEQLLSQLTREIDSRQAMILTALNDRWLGDRYVVSVTTNERGLRVECR
jgi:hypothetical protein